MKTQLAAMLATALALGLAAPLAYAQTSVDDCGFEHPKFAKETRSSLVQAFVSCGNPGGNTPNDTTEGGVPSCAPPQTYREHSGSAPNGWMWDEARSFGTVQFRSIVNKVVSPLNPPNNSGDLSVKLKLRGVVDAAGPASGPGTLSTLARATLRDRQNTPNTTSDDVPMTVVDFPAPFGFNLENGSASLKSSANALLNGIGQPGLPQCASVSLVDVSVVDENGNRFAEMGTLLPSKHGAQD